jgi:Dolichyl-phosphate-mannose-protein mannosyltransferase
MTEDRRTRRRFTLLVTVGSAIYLYLVLFTLKGIPFLLNGDQVYFWTFGMRMLQGERIYRDFFTMHPPGADLFYAAMFALFGSHIWVTNFSVLVLGVALSWLCFKVAAQIMDTRLALLAAALFLVPLYGKLLNGTHHWFSVFAVMAAVAICMPDINNRRIAAAGALLGAATFFTQTRGPFALIAFAAFLLWNKFRSKESWPQLLQSQALLFVSFLAALALLSSYFIATIGLKQLWYFQVTYVHEHLLGSFGAMSLGLPDNLNWQKLPFFGRYFGLGQYLFVYGLLLVIYPLVLWLAMRDRHGKTGRNWRPIILMALVGFCLFAEVAISVNWLRIFVVSMPGIILLAWLLDSPAKFRRCAVVFLWCVVVCMALMQVGVKQFRPSIVTNLPAGRAMVKPQVFEKLDWIAQHTKPEDLFFQAGWTDVYLPLRLRNPVFLDMLTTVQSSPEYVDLAIRQLDAKRVRYVLWQPRFDSPDPLYPPQLYQLQPFRDYLHTHYHRVRSFSDQDELWERN